MSNSYKVTILMNCRNGEKYVDQALESIKAQTYKNWEVIFVDNQSTDRSIEIAKSFGDKIKIISTPRPMSLCEGRVFARPYITGDFFCVLDIDDLWLPTKLEKQVNIMTAYPDVGVVYTNTIYFTDEGKESFAYNSIKPSGMIFKDILREYFFSLETVMIRRSSMEKHDLYFSDRYNVSSDMELFTKLCYWEKVYYINEPLAKWRYGNTNESISQFLSFPREYELLIEDLTKMVPNFEADYASELMQLRGTIQNMYGLANWKQGKRLKAFQHMARAVTFNKKYLVPLAAIACMPHSMYDRMRKSFRPI